MALSFLFDPNKQFQNPNGTNAVGGFLRVYLNGTDDRATTYKDFSGTLNEADIVLDANGRAVVIVDNSAIYRIEVYSFGGTLMWTISNFTAQGGSGGSATPVAIEGTDNEIEVESTTSAGVKYFVLSLAAAVKNTLSSLASSVTSLTSAVSQRELLANKKDTLVGYEASTTDYPTIKAVVDFINSAMQNLGGKLITDNGEPFTDSSDLPSTTPYNGVDINDYDYAYVQGTGFAERWSATVTGSSVAWVNEYTINIPVLTPSQQAAIDSGITAAILCNLLAKDGNGSDVTATFTAAGSRTNISTGEKLSVIFGKVAKWFSDLKAVAFSGSYNDLSDKPTIPSVPTAYTSAPNMDGTASAGSSTSWSRGDHTHPHDSSKQDSLPYSDGKYGISISGSASNAHSLDDVKPVGFGKDDSGPYYQELGYTPQRGAAGATTTLIVHGQGDIGDLSSNWLVEIWYHGTPKINVYSFGPYGTQIKFGYWIDTDANSTMHIVAKYPPFSRNNLTMLMVNKDGGFVANVKTATLSEPSGMVWAATNRLTFAPYGTARGSSSVPVYVDQYGELKACDMAKYCTRWNSTTVQWITYNTSHDVRLWYAKNYCVNYATIELNSSHPTLCYIICTLPALESNEIYDLSFEITINSVVDVDVGRYAIFLLDSEDSGYTLLGEYAQNGSGKFINTPLRNLTLPSNGITAKYKVKVNGHSYSVVPYL